MTTWLVVEASLRSTITSCVKQQQRRASSAGSPTAATLALLVVFFLAHYLFTSVTAHVTAMLPVMLAVASRIAGLDMAQFALLLCLTLGLMGIVTPYGTGSLPSRDWWWLGAVFGVVFLATFVLVGVPWVRWLGS